MTIYERRKKIGDLEWELSRLKTNCPHEVENKFGNAFCIGCNRNFGRFCEDSPDNTCHSSTFAGEGKRICTINNVWLDLPADKQHDGDVMAGNCLFCGKL